MFALRPLALWGFLGFCVLYFQKQEQARMIDSILLVGVNALIGINGVVLGFVF